DRAADEALLAVVRSWAVERLPGYMVPPTLTVLEELPLSANGKVDRTALPDPTTTQPTGRDTTPPTTELEKKILGVVIARSDHERVGVLDNFFELGLDSLTITRIYRDLRDELGLSFPITTLFGEPNVRRLAAHLAGAGTGPAPAQAALDRARRRRETLARRGK
ncbi:phosphopantetheine-binding protein, partial [Streptomyces nanhaiensis]|uniref:phosphopantetheine-binding protein n=1 Tax=Streptomyces nanhaiensis TaxID=679319 RepID=UPI00399CFB50